MKTIGAVSGIWRYPVKSFAGERLSTVEVVSTGLFGDRSYAYIDPSKSGWSRYITARRAPDMLRYRASLAEPDDDSVPSLAVTTPDGDVFGWEEALHRRIQKIADVNIEPFSCDSEEPAFDEAPILIVTDASVRSLQTHWGKPLDSLRFRPNVMIDLGDDTPFVERSWIGRSIRLGNGVVLRIDALCSRCQMIGYDPRTVAADSSLLSLLADEQDACFGVYASVVTIGQMSEGDPVIVYD